jgi:hypothetical protein
LQACGGLSDERTGLSFTRDFIYENTVRTSQETHYVSATKLSRLKLFEETVAIYYENHTEHIDILCGQNAEFLHVEAGGRHGNHLDIKG